MSHISSLKKISIIESIKEFEYRIPIHLDHFHLIPLHLRKCISFQENYGKRFGFIDADLIEAGFTVESREELLSSSSHILLLKPEEEDVKKMKMGAALYGWCHCAQRKIFTDIAIDRQLTLVTMESMYKDGCLSNPMDHLFVENNLLAGEASVESALSYYGIKPGRHEKPLHALVIGYGATGIGATKMLMSLGIKNITVLTRRDTNTLSSKFPGINYKKITVDKDIVILHDTGQPIRELYKDAIIIINAIRQNLHKPLMFISEGEECFLKKETLIVDISCDNKMGFYFASSTTHYQPIKKCHHFYYYSIDNTPSIFWKTASLIVSKILTPLLVADIPGDLKRIILN